MKRVHIIGAGGPAGVGMTRCLKDHYALTGEDSSQWAELMMECPTYGSGKHPDYDTYHGSDGKTIPYPDMELFMADSLIAGQVMPRNFLPPRSHINLCRDKAKLAEVMGDLAPKTYWVRDTVGAGGSGAQMQSEYLPGDNYSVEFVAFQGKILASFQKKRVSYSVKSKTQGIDNRGSSAVSVVTDDPAVNLTANEALKRLSVHTERSAHGFYGIDLKCDENGVPKVTEINAGRLLTASYAFFSGTGYNLPLVGVAAHLGDGTPTPELPEYPLGWGQIRQVGQEPRLFPPDVTATW